MKKKLVLAAPFIVTVSALAACDDPKPEPMPVHGNPPAPDPTTPSTPPAVPSASASATASAAPLSAIIGRNPPPFRFLNEEIDGEPVLKSKGKCTAGSKSVACPESMKSAAWDKCDGGRIRKEPAMCQCQWTGSNPPAPKEIPCP